MYFPDLFMKKCRLCGKEIYPTPEWVYRRVNFWYCGWSCYRRDAPPPKRVQPCAYKQKPVEQIDRLTGDVLAVYSCAKEAAERIGGNIEGIRQCCRGQIGSSFGFAWRYKEDKNHD